jgi:isopenicillin-N N-acyltransferase-like protein
MSESVERAETAAFPLIDIEGPALVRGRSYGRQAGERIQRSLSIYREILARDGMDWSQAREISRAIIPDVEARYPDSVEEIRGIAAGAECTIEDIFAINARTELLYGHGSNDENDPDGCTGAVAMAEVTRSGHLLHGQNWDWKDDCADSSIVLRIHPDKGLPMLTFVEAGLLARCGFNSAGIGLTGNHLKCEHDAGRRSGTPIPFVRREVLEHPTLAGAARAVMTARLGFSNNMLISDAGNEVINLEVTPVETFWVTAEEGLLVHANHFIAPSARAKLRDLSLLSNTDSLYRDVRVRKHLRNAAPEITIETLQAAFQDRYGSPRAVCRSLFTADNGLPSATTVSTILMDTTLRKMWVAPRPYGPHRFTEYTLD